MIQPVETVFEKLDSILEKNSSGDLAAEQRSTKLIVELYYLLWETPNFRVQQQLVDRVLDRIGSNTAKCLLGHIIDVFSKIEVDRRDKFFYYINRTLHLMSFKEILTIKDLSVLEYACRILNERRCDDWNDALFVEFMAYCKPWICSQFKNVRVPEHVVREVLERGDINNQNRSALYNLFL